MAITKEVETEEKPEVKVTVEVTAKVSNNSFDSMRIHILVAFLKMKKNGFKT